MNALAERDACPHSPIRISFERSRSACDLELAKQQFENDPTDPGNLQTLAWAYWGVDDKAQAFRNARRYLNSVPASRRPQEVVNWMFMMDAWQRGDEETMLGYMGPLEARVDGTFEAGIDFAFLRPLRVLHGHLPDLRHPG